MDIKKEIVIDASSSRIYDAITDIKQLQQWFPDVVSLEPYVGGKIAFQFSNSDFDLPRVIEGKITRLENNKKLAYTWSHPTVSDFPITQVTWNLESISENKTRVVITHSGFLDESMLNLYNKKWLWITEHLDTFAASQKPVSTREQAFSGLIPGVDIWAFYRIKKLIKSTLYITGPSIIMIIILTNVTLSLHADFQSELISYEQYVNSISILLLVTTSFVVSILALSNYLLHKWTKQWNQQFTETKKHRPIGIFILVGVYVFDAALMAIFIGFYAGVYELQVLVEQTPELLSYSEDLEIISFGDWIVELGVWVVIADIVVVVALLSARERGRKIAIVFISGGILFNALIFGPYGLAINGIALWYILRTKTKESFKITA